MSTEFTRRADGEGSFYQWRGGAIWADRLDEYHSMLRADHYEPPRTDGEKGIYLNSASIPFPFAESRDIALQVRALLQSDSLEEAEQDRQIERARKMAAQLVNMQDEKGVALFRNTSEAISYFVWLSGMFENINDPLTVLTTDSENPSVYRDIEFIRDHSNPHRTDAITTYSPWRKEPTYPPIAAIKTDFRIARARTERVNIEQTKSELEECVALYKPQVFLVSHVLRSTGRALPIQELIALVRDAKRRYHPDDPEIFVCVDGAQALGNLPQIDVQQIGSDMYATSPHKTLMSEPLGVVYFDPENPRIAPNLQKLNTIQPHWQVLLQGMFHPDLAIRPNVADRFYSPEIPALQKTIETLEARGLLHGNDFSVLDQKRSALRSYCAEKLQGIALGPDRDLRIIEPDQPTNFILSFRFGEDPFVLEELYQSGSQYASEFGYEPGYISPYVQPQDSFEKHLAEELGKRGVALTFMRRGKVFRVSFNAETTTQDIDIFVKTMRAILNEKSL